MSSEIMGSPWGALVILLIALLVHEPWRWLGLYIGNRLSVSSPIFLWVKACATSLVAALVMRLVLFPAGALASVGLGVRVIALLAGIGIFVAFQRSMAAGVFGAAVVLVAMQLIVTTL